MKTAALKDVCEIITRGISPKYTVDTTVGVTVLNQKCIRDHSISLEHSRLHDISAKSVTEAKFVRSGDVLVNSTGHGTLGRTALAEDISDDIVVDSHITIIRPKPGLFESRYFAYLIGMHEDEFINMATGTSGQTELPRALLNDYKIYYDESLEEQRRIVTKLDVAFEKIDRAAELNGLNIQNAKKLYDSFLNKEFESSRQWSSEALESNVKFIDYRGKTPKKTEDGIRLITAKNIRLGHLNREPEEYVSPDIYESWMVRGIPVKGDVLFTTEAPLANVAQLDTDERVVFAQRCIILQPNRDYIDPEFLKYSLLAGPVRLSIFDNATGTTVSGIRAALLKKIKIYLPARRTQELIVARVNKIRDISDALIKKYERKACDLQLLKQSLLNDAFPESAVK